MQSQAEPVQAGRVATSSIGQVGQRQRQDQTSADIASMTRIESRIQNRVQSRIRNRIDQTYDPQGDVASPFATAEDQARAASRRGR